jgi:hypothetical protein
MQARFEVSAGDVLHAMPSRKRIRSVWMCTRQWAQSERDKPEGGDLIPHNSSQNGCDGTRSGQNHASRRDLPE